jgi:cyclophilin family peptidyl-prolyl cis-trans isomerase
MHKSYKRNIFLQITAIICGFFLISASGCNETGLSRVVIHTEFGDMVVVLSDSTPGHRDNFLKLASEGFYDELLFHRVMSGFMIQGGDPKSKDATPEARLGSGGPGYKIDAEIRADLHHVKGALAAARQGDQSNPARRSSGSQFYLVHGKKWSDRQLEGIENSAQQLVSGFTYSDSVKTIYKEIGGAPFLDLNYTVFGMVVEGLDILDSIAAVKTKPGDRPVEDVKFSVEVLY